MTTVLVHPLSLHLLSHSCRHLSLGLRSGLIQHLIAWIQGTCYVLEWICRATSMLEWNKPQQGHVWCRAWICRYPCAGRCPARPSAATAGCIGPHSHTSSFTQSFGTSISINACTSACSQAGEPATNHFCKLVDGAEFSDCRAHKLAGLHGCVLQACPSLLPLTPHPNAAVQVSCVVPRQHLVCWGQIWGQL